MEHHRLLGGTAQYRLEEDLKLSAVQAQQSLAAAWTSSSSWAADDINDGSSDGAASIFSSTHMWNSSSIVIDTAIDIDLSPSARTIALIATPFGVWIFIVCCVLFCGRTWWRQHAKKKDHLTKERESIERYERKEQ